MKSNVFICPPCGESVALATKEGQNKNKALWPLLPRLTAVLPPQGREMSFGFTLIELLVVVLIIGILAAVAVPQYKKAVAKARTAEALAMLKSLVNAEEVYYLANGEYTPDISKLDVDVPENQIIADFARADPNQFNTYMYSCRERSCSANSCNADVPLLEFYVSKYEVGEGQHDSRGMAVCIPYTWTAGCEKKNNIAEDICKSLNGGNRTTWPYEWTSGSGGSTTYYQIN